MSKSALSRLPLYLSYLKALPKNNPVNISATTIANELKLGDVQVRKDLNNVSTGGRPRLGYVVSDLICDLEKFLGYNDINDAVIIGAGKIGKALLEYSGFKEFGLNIIAGFDVDAYIIGETENQKSIFHVSKFSDLCQRLNVKIGVIAVPASVAQESCNLMIQNGILAIWNFAPAHLNVPDNILVHNENMAASLAILSGHLRSKQV